MRNSGSCEPRLIVAVSSHSQYHYFVGVYQQSVFPLPMAVGIGLDWIAVWMWAPWHAKQSWCRLHTGGEAGSAEGALIMMDCEKGRQSVSARGWNQFLPYLGQKC